MALKNSTYDPDQKNKDLNHLTDVNPGEEHEMEVAARKSQLKDLEDMYDQPAIKDKDRNASPEKLAEAERTNNDFIGGGYRDEAKKTVTDKAKGSFRDQTITFLKKNVTKKRAAMGGGMASFLVILLLMSSGFSSFELINLRENALGHGNRFTNRILAKRRAQSFGHMIKQMSDEKVPEKQRERIKEKFEEKGFKVEFDREGKLTKFDFKTSDGKTHSYDIKQTDEIKASNNFFGGKGPGLEASRAFDKVASATGGFWRGPGAEIAFKGRFKFFNWLDRKPSDEAKTTREKLADNLRASNVQEQEALRADIQNAKSKQELGDGQPTGEKDANGNPVDAKVTDSGDLLNGELNNNLTPAEYQARLLKSPKATDNIIGVKSDSAVQDLVNGTEDALDTGGIKSEEALGKLGKGLFKGSLTALFRSFNAVGIAQDACEVKGILNFVSNYRNIVLTIELARFAVRILNAADDQKAGILTGEGLNLLMIYMTTPNPETGRGHTGAGGEMWLKGDETAGVAGFFKSLYSTGRGYDGILGRIYSFVNGIPGADKCHIVNNGFVTAGGLVVGAVAAVASGGTINAGQIALSLTMAAMHEIVIQVATPMLIKAGAHMIADGYENGEMAGNMFTSGFDALAGLVAGGSGLLPSTISQLSELEPEVEDYQRAEIADQSIFERYLSPSNNDSLATQVASAMPGSLQAAAVSFSSGITGLLQNLTSFSFLNAFMPGNAKRAHALTTNCNDPQVRALKIATDPFCNPIFAKAPSLNLTQTKAILEKYKQIDENGLPTDTKEGDGNKSFKEFVDLCFSARPGVLYNPNPDKEGNASPTDNTCTENGPPLPGDSVGRYMRFAAWFGYSNDEQSIKKQLGLVEIAANTTKDLSDPKNREAAMMLVSSAENSTLDWKAQYGYIEYNVEGNAAENRGYTGGVVGFTSKTGDMLDLVKYYNQIKPNNALTKYIPALEKVNGTSSQTGLGAGFVSAWKTAAKDPKFQEAQDHEVDQIYFNPALNQAKADGLGVLGQFIYFDALVMHGPGTDPDSFGGIRNAAIAKAQTPTTGGNETVYLNAFLDVRKAAMLNEAGHSDTSRVDTEQRAFLKANNLTLTRPLSWSTYGDSYTLTEQMIDTYIATGKI